MGKVNLLKKWSVKYPRHAWALDQLPPHRSKPLQLSIEFAGGLGAQEMVYLWKKASFLENLPKDAYNGQQVQDREYEEIWVYIKEKESWECS